MRDKIEAALKALGSTSREVADKLIARGIKAGHGAKDCPIAQYMNQELGPKFSVLPENTLCLGEPILAKNPEGVREFVIDYDSNKYPELVAAGDELPRER